MTKTKTETNERMRELKLSERLGLRLECKERPSCDDIEMAKAMEAEVEGLKKPIQYMIDVWDEVTGKTWRESPDHVQQKFIEAENLLKLTEAGKK